MEKYNLAYTQKIFTQFLIYFSEPYYLKVETNC